MSSFEFNKIFAAFLLAALIAMMSGFIADKLVEPEKLESDAYVIEVAEQPVSPGATAAPAGPGDIKPLLVSSDVAAGQRLTRACVACHSFDKGGPNKVGPNLWGVVGADKAHASGYAYSAAMSSAEGSWTYDDLNEFLYNPKTAVPGTKMSYAGMKNIQDRATLIAYLRTLAETPPPLP